jgi:hypothetical protein
MRFEDFFSGYAQQMKNVRVAQREGDFVHAISLIPQHKKQHNTYSLSLLEKGRLAFLQQNRTESQLYFNSALQSIEKENAKASIQISKGLSHASAVVSNDNAIMYQVPAYEQSMMHSYQALNYVYQGQLESALVEVRKANIVQENALKVNEDEVLSAQKEMAKKGIQSDSLYANYPSMREVVGDVKNGFQNAFTFYLSALLYESAGEENDAYIDYKKALEIFPDNQYIKADTSRLAKKLNIVDDAVKDNTEKKSVDLMTNQSEKLSVKPSSESGQVVILYEQGLIAEKQEVKLNVPIFTRHNDMRFFSFALPVYREDYQEAKRMPSPLQLQYEQQTYHSDEIVVLQSLASKHLQEQLPSIVTRQAFRVAAKEQLRKKMSQEAGDFGNVLASLYSMASEKADTRSWLTLPNRIHLLKVNLPVGYHTLELEHINGRSVIDITINTDRISLINLTTVGNYTGFNVVNL